MVNMKPESKCSVKLFLIHIYNNIQDNPEFTFTSKELSVHFGCSIQASVNLVRRIRGYSFLTTVGDRNYCTLYKLNSRGIEYAKRLKEKIELNSGIPL